jgi:hypothetical protein
VFSLPEGQLILDWLRSFTVNEILGPESSDAALRFREGGRFVVAAIMTRMERGTQNGIRPTLSQLDTTRSARSSPRRPRNTPRSA